MSRITVCLFFIAILQTGLITISQASDLETATKPKDAEKDTESKVPSKVEVEQKSAVSSTTEPKDKVASDEPLKKDNERTEEKEAKASESKKDTDSKKTGDLTDASKDVSAKNGKDDFPINILGPVTAAGAKIGEAFSKSIDTARDFAGSTFNFMRTSASSIFS